MDLSNHSPKGERISIKCLDWFLWSLKHMKLKSLKKSFRIYNGKQKFLILFFTIFKSEKRFFSLKYVSFLVLAINRNDRIIFWIIITDFSCFFLSFFCYFSFYIFWSIFFLFDWSAPDISKNESFSIIIL